MPVLLGRKRDAKKETRREGGRERGTERRKVKEGLRKKEGSLKRGKATVCKECEGKGKVWTEFKLK